MRVPDWVTLPGAREAPAWQYDSIACRARAWIAAADPRGALAA